MFGSWIFYAVVALTTASAGLLMTKRGKSWVRRMRKKQWRKTKADTKGAWRAHRAARAQTPRGRVKAARKRNPKRLTVGHRRSPNDPTRTRKVARRTKTGTAKVAKAAVNRYRLARANRTAKKTPRRQLGGGPKLFPGEGKSPGSLTGTERSQALRSAGLCGAPTQDKGYCQNRKVIGGDRCQVHGGRSAA